MTDAPSVLVTGATGFVGRPTVELLRRQGWTVHAIARRPPSAPAVGVVWHDLDLLSGEDLESMVSGIGASHLLHLAWCADPGRFWSDPANLDWLRASTRLVAAFAAGGGRHAVAVGSCAEYDWSHGWCREDVTPLRPDSLYGSAKAAAGTAILAWGREVGVSISWARLFQVFGPGEPSGKLISSILDGLREQRRIPLSEGQQIRDFIHVHDVARALVHLLAVDGMGAVNVGSGLGVRVRDVALTLAGACDSLDLLDFGAIGVPPERHPFLVADVSRLGSTGWASTIDVTEGLTELVRTSA